MTGGRSRQSNEGGRGATGTTTHPRTNRLIGYSECRFCYYYRLIVGQSGIRNLHSQEQGWYMGRSERRHSCRAKVVWEMSVHRELVT